MNEPAISRIAIELLDPAAAEDADLVSRLVEVINVVYATGEAGVWKPDARRTSAAEMAELATGEFGMLAADHAHRGVGVGRELVAFAEGLSRNRGHRTMQLELLVPRVGKHPNKVFLDDWYSRIGYRVVRTISLADAYPALAPLLATECEFVIYEKPLEAFV
jgi:GNAT superfamily N-acetyltransferase